MPNAPIQPPVPRQIDPSKFAQQGICLKGNVEISSLSRLVEVLEDSEGEVAIDLKFAIDEQKARTLRGTVDTHAKVICQRCLDTVVLDLHCELSLAVVRDEDEAKQLPSYLEPWIADEGMVDLYSVIEEELLLALPLAAYHDTACVEPSLFSSGEGEVETGTVSAENPFQALKQLKD